MQGDLYERLTTEGLQQQITTVSFSFAWAICVNIIQEYKTYGDLMTQSFWS